MTDDLQRFVLDCLGAAKPARKKRGRAPTGLIPDVTIPRAKPIARAIIRYAETQKITADILGQRMYECEVVGQPEVEPEGLVFRLEQNALGTPGQHRFEVPYLNDTMRRLCHGEWVDVAGRKQISMHRDSLWPSVKKQGEAAILHWAQAPEMRWDRFLIRHYEVRLAQVVILPTHGELVPSPFPDWVFPKLVWGE